MSNKTLKKYADFIDDSDFLKEFLPDLKLDQADSIDGAKPESFIFTQSPAYVTVKLRSYQLEGLNWLVKMHENGINCILADEMGLGKTLQSISLLGYIKLVRMERAKHLVIVPKSCLQNWKNEFERFVPGLRAAVFHTSRADVQKDSKILHSKHVDVILTTYEMCLFARAALKKINWCYVVVDEAHRLKNENSQLSQIVRMFTVKHRLLLTGTPLQNNIHELWALLNFIVPEIFSNSENFEKYVLTADQEERSIHKLRSVLQLFFLRREKVDVERTLLPKRVLNLYCPLSEMQREWYKSILSKDLTNVSLGGNAKASLLNIVMQLKKCCNHPYLFPGAEPEPYETGGHLITNSGKMVVLDKLLRSLKQKGSRVLLFSQMALMVDILEDYAVYRDYSYCRIDGRTSLADRTAAIEDFNRPDSDKFLFLLTTRAGGLGINLYTADVVVIFDSDWNPQADLQAQDRAHRIGQQRQVNVFRFITESSVEEGIVRRAQQKLRLDDILLQNGQKKVPNALSQSEIMDILTAGLNATEERDVDVDMSIEDLLKRGEEKTMRMNEHLESLKIGDTVDSKINLYQWEGENYAKRKLSDFIETHAAERPTRTSLFSTRKFQALHFPDYQFYPHEFYELQKHEEELFNRRESLSPEEEKRKEELLSQGFDWTKKDFKTFVAALDAYGDDIAAIKERLPHRSDVEEYYRTFWERHDELGDGEKIMAMLGRNKLRNERKLRLRGIFSKYGDMIEEHTISKNRFYTDNKYLLNLYAKYIDHPRCFEMIKLQILENDNFMFDYYLLSRTTQELSKHINALTGQLLKAFDK